MAYEGRVLCDELMMGAEGTSPMDGFMVAPA
jgi:hypothetical protein